MKFGKNQELKFGTRNGAYSIVTPRENKDGQITVTDAEANLLLSFFGKENIFKGKVGDNPKMAEKPFKLYPSGEKIFLNFVYPKPEKSELRLYIGVRRGFKPDGGDIWFMYEDGGDIWIGSMSEASWRSQSQILIYDESEGSYQDAIQELDEVKINTLKSRDVYARDRKKALRRIELSGYQCEYDPQHHLFISHATQKPYLEAHHLIPMSLQGEIQAPLDTTDNIYCLCPHCHRAIHHAEKPLAKNIIDTLLEKRPDVLSSTNTDISNIYSFYAVESIS